MGGVHGRARAVCLLAVALPLAGTLGGCASGLSRLRDVELPPRARVEGVPVLVQTEDHCGPTSLASLLAWAGHPETPEALAPLVYLPGRSGTLPIDLPREVRARGLLAYRVRPHFEALLAEAGAGHPVLLLENRGLGWLPRWHYSVLTGYDLSEGIAVLHAGGPAPEGVALGRLRRTWERGGAFGLLALPPGRLPAGDDREGILESLADLEEGGHALQAGAGYEAFARRWAGDWRGTFGLGNARYAVGDLPGAEDAFRRSHAVGSGRPEPLNNLALLLAQAGRAGEARVLAERAVGNARLLGMDPSPYQHTLRTLEPGGGGPR
ncbi:MAG: PA2778 family cysteine peptidase [Deferrisomatales bacterium]|nr:PA2778 family cysteine peptidase [Deferrisomatales bacterium]